MGFLRDQASRLIRTKWGGNVDRAMEELYAIFTGDEPITFDSPVTITTNPGDASPPLTLRDYGTSDAPLQISRSPAAPANQPDQPPPDFSGDGVGGITFLNVYADGSAETWSGDRANPPSTKPGTGTPAESGAGGGGFPGQVLSGGPGDTYTVAVYENGLAGSPVSRTVRQLSIAADQTIPAGTWATIVVVRESDGSSTRAMQVPVWLEDLP